MTILTQLGRNIVEVATLFPILTGLEIETQTYGADSDIVTSCIAVYLIPVLLINLFHNSAIHLYPRRAYSNRILIQIELQTKKKNRL